MELPLSGIRVVDHVAGPLASATRYLAELGATVDRVDHDTPHQEIDRFDRLADNAGKTVHTALSEEAFHSLLARADVIVSDDPAMDFDRWHAANPALVSMTISEFGRGTDFDHWQATDPVLHALSGVLSRSGIKGKAPLLPPHGLAYQCAATQAAYAILTSLYRSLTTGEGDRLEFAAIDGSIQALDPGYGVSGSATMGRPAKLLSRSRPPRGYLYPIFPCADGFVRVCILSSKQWQAMFKWLGEPAEFADPRLNNTEARYREKNLIPTIAAMFATCTRAELEAEGKARNIPVSAVNSLSEITDTDHFRVREMFASVDTGESKAQLARSAFVIDGKRADSSASCELASREISAPANLRSDLAYEGLRVVDLGIIVVGAETGRLFADQGADVIKVESRAFPDGNRASYLPYDLSASFAAGHRNKRSIGLDLRHPKGRETLLSLIKNADVVLSNFKPGTLRSLNLDQATLESANPAIVMIESSAFGASGPWGDRMGYGPLVRAATGLTETWSYPGEPGEFADSLTIYPDHTAARVGAMAAIALLIRRLRTGTGGHVEIAQAEVMLSHLAADIARQSTQARQELDRPWGVYPTLGDDDWCVVTVRGDADWQRLAPLIGLEQEPGLHERSGRIAAAATIDAALREWLSSRSAFAAAQELQAAGVPAAPMLRIADLPEFPLYVQRDFYLTYRHPYLAEDLLMERRHVGRSSLSASPTRPAPMSGEHSVDIVKGWLGLEQDEINKLVDEGVLQPTDQAVFAVIKETLGQS